MKWIAVIAGQTRTIEDESPRSIMERVPESQLDLVAPEVIS